MAILLLILAAAALFSVCFAWLIIWLTYLVLRLPRNEGRVLLQSRQVRELLSEAARDIERQRTVPSTKIMPRSGAA